MGLAHISNASVHAAASTAMISRSNWLHAGLFEFRIAPGKIAKHPAPCFAGSRCLSQRFQDWRPALLLAADSFHVPTCHPDSNNTYFVAVPLISHRPRFRVAANRVPNRKRLHRPSTIAQGFILCQKQSQYTAPGACASMYLFMLFRLDTALLDGSAPRIETQCYLHVRVHAPANAWSLYRHVPVRASPNA